VCCSGEASCEWGQSWPYLLGVGLVLVCIGAIRKVQIDNPDGFRENGMCNWKLLLCLSVVGTLILSVVLCISKDTRVLGIVLAVACILCYCCVGLRDAGKGDAPPSPLE
jgi:hypothetical protein